MDGWLFCLFWGWDKVGVYGLGWGWLGWVGLYFMGLWGDGEMRKCVHACVCFYIVGRNEWGGFEVMGEERWMGCLVHGAWR